MLDDSGWEYVAELRSVQPAQVAGILVERCRSAAEPRLHVRLYQGLLKGEKMDWVLQKGTEVGVSGFVPLVTERTVPRLEADAAGHRLARWRAIVREAAEQSRRGKLPLLEAPIPFADACAQKAGPAYLLWEEEEVVGLRQALTSLDAGSPAGSGSVSLFVGPEGGFTREEAVLASRHGVQPVSLGRRVLRAETAGVIAAALVLYHFQELGDPPGP